MLAIGIGLSTLSKVPLALLVREVHELYEPIADDKHIALRVDQADDVAVDGDRDRLLETIANLVDAIKFTPRPIARQSEYFVRHFCRCKKPETLQRGALIQVNDSGRKGYIAPRPDMLNGNSA